MRSTVRARTPKDKKFIPLTEKVFEVLRSFEENPLDALALDQITASTGMAKTTVHRLLYSIKQLGYIDQEANGNYRFSDRFYSLSGHGLAYYPLISAARPYLNQMAAKSGEAVQIGVLSNHVMMLVDVEPSRKSYRCNGVVSDCNFAHCTSIGKCILANLSLEERGAYLDARGLPKFTAHTITDRSQFELELEKIRSQGWALNDGENVEGVVTVAAPLFGADRAVLAGIGISGPLNRMHAMLDEHKVTVMRAAERLSLALVHSLS